MRQRALIIVLGGALVVALTAWWRWPSSSPTLDCPDGALSLDDEGVAHCGAGRPLSAGQTLTAGRKLDLNSASADDLALLPGVGPQLATALVKARADQGGFDSWDQVDAVVGVGPARLVTLQQTCELRRSDAGL